MRSLEELKNLPISTSQRDLSNGISLVFDLIKNNAKGSNTDYAEAFYDVITYQSYAGAITSDEENRILNWIDETYDEVNEDYIDAVSGLYCIMSSKRALKELKNRISTTKYSWVRKYYQEAIEEFELRT
ncbi:hypothetical protein [Marinicellulosiphila megalodicopiae]|uniref:hypothetical protein n=1 Tax=Marinicellulosiphila megalodicopiae TaxID=2724896 RepID=UPI003BAFE9CB